MGIPVANTSKQNGSIPWVFVGGDHLSQAVMKYGIPVDSAEDNEAQEIGKYERLESLRSMISDGVLVGNVWEDGINRNSFGVAYSVGSPHLQIQPGRAMVGKKRVDLGLGVTADGPLLSTTAASSIFGYALPASGQEHVFYIRVYDRSIQGTIYFPPAGNAANRSKYFDMLLDVTYYNSATPGAAFSPPNTADVPSQSFLEIARIDSSGNVTDKRSHAKFRNIYAPGIYPDVDLTISANFVSITQGNHTFDAGGTVNRIFTDLRLSGRIVLFRGTTGQTVILTNNGAGAFGDKLYTANGVDVSLRTELDSIAFQQLDDGSYVEIYRSFGAKGTPVRLDGRLTLSTGVPVTTTDQTGKTTIYLSPFNGNLLSLFDGAAWHNYDFTTEISIAVPASTNQMYDIFVYDNSGTLTLEAVAWTNDTNRAIGIVLQNGTYVKSGTTTKRYVGSFRTTGSSGQTEDSNAKRYLWNYYNRVSKKMLIRDATLSWAYTGGYRQARATATNQLDMVIGVSEDIIECNVNAGANINLAVGGLATVGIGVDSTAVNSADTHQGFAVGAITSTGIGFPLSASYKGFPGVGRHTLVWLEKGATDATFYGDNSTAGDGSVFSGIHGLIKG